MTLKLSTNELFHFTKFDRLLNIIKQGFYPRYNLEYTFLSNLFDRPGVFIFVPMVCFCDIPLSMAQEHCLKYGNYAIGLDKQWGERYGLNPVLYVHKNTIVADALSALANSFSNYKSSMIAKDSDIRIFTMFAQFGIGLQQLSYFVKQYERVNEEHFYIGDKSGTFPIGRFYDEREWRYVPPDSKDDSWLINLNLFGNEEGLAIANENLKKYSLQFDFNDIKYILYETESEMDKLIVLISKNFGLDKETVVKNIIFAKVNET